MQSDNASGDGKPHAEALMVAGEGHIGLREGFEAARDILGWHAWAIILDGEFQPLAFPRGNEAQRGRAPGMFQHVMDQAGECGGKQRLVALEIQIIHLLASLDADASDRGGLRRRGENVSLQSAMAQSIVICP